MSGCLKKNGGCRWLTSRSSPHPLPLTPCRMNIKEGGMFEMRGEVSPLREFVIHLFD